MMLTFFHAISSLRLEDQFWSDTNFRVPSSHRSARRIEADSSHELPETFRFSIPSLRGGYKGQGAPRARTRPWTGCFTVNHLNQAWKEMESYSTWCVSARFGSWMSSQKICTQMSSFFCMIIWYFLVLHLAVFGLFRIALSKRRAEKRKKLERKNNFSCCRQQTVSQTVSRNIPNANIWFVWNQATLTAMVWPWIWEGFISLKKERAVKRLWDESWVQTHMLGVCGLYCSSRAQGYLAVAAAFDRAVESENDLFGIRQVSCNFFRHLAYIFVWRMKGVCTEIDYKILTDTLYCCFEIWKIRYCKTSWRCRHLCDFASLPIVFRHCSSGPHQTIGQIEGA